MSLETEIEKLREAIEAATKGFAELTRSVITSQQFEKPIEVKVSGIKQKEELKKEELKKETEEVEKISFEDVHQIAKEKMEKPNINRNAIKKIITDIKADAQISDLNDDELVTAFNNISKL